MRSFHHIAAAMALMALMALISVATAWLAVGQIERLVGSDVHEALTSESMSWAGASVDGLKVVLSGTAPDEATRHRAQRLVTNAVDSVLVIDAMQTEQRHDPEPRELSVEFLRSEGEITVMGVVPRTVDRVEMAEEIARLTGGGKVRDLLETVDYPMPPGWRQAFGFSLEALGQLPWSRITVRDGTVEIKAISESSESRRRIESSLRERVADGVDLSLDISTPRPVIAPFTLRFLVDAKGGRFDACSADNEDDGDRIVSAAARAGLRGDATCRTGLGVPSPHWPEAVVAGIDAVGRLGTGSVSVSDMQVFLVAPAETEQSRFDRVIEELGKALPGGFSLAAIISDPATVEGVGEGNLGRVPEFVAAVSPEGLLHLGGSVTDENLRAAVEGLSRAFFANSSLQSALRIDPELPEAWAKRVFAGLGSLSVLAAGNLVVRPELIKVSGHAHDPNASDEVSRILSASLGATEVFTIEVSYVEPEDTTPDTPSAEECVASIGAILEDRKIGFEPGSPEIGHRSFPVIDRIAEVMEDCSEVRMEIGGHTDSQGREEMNLQLSQRRAESVLVALQTRRVLTGNLIPVGYGETRPIADNRTEEGREANRRIEFTLATEGESAEGTGEDNEQN